MAQQRDFDTRQPLVWDDGNPRMAVVVTLDVAGDRMSLWAPKPSAMFKAFGEAQAVVGRPVQVGDTITVTLSGTKADPNRPHRSPQKLYTVQITPGDPFAPDANGTAAPAVSRETTVPGAQMPAGPSVVAPTSTTAAPVTGAPQGATGTPVADMFTLPPNIDADTRAAILSSLGLPVQ